MKLIENYVEKKLDKLNLQRFASAFFCGIIFSMAVIGSVTFSTLAQGIMSKILLSVTFPMGLFIIVANGYDLFTSSVMNFKKLTRPKKRGYAGLAVSVVYIGNLLGTVFAIFVLHALGVLERLHLVEAFYSIYISKTSLLPYQVLFLGVLCNFLICMAVYLSLHGESFLEKCAYMFIPVFLFVLLGFEHSVANMVYFSAAIFSSKAAVMPALLNIFFATIGNLGGGLLFLFSVWAKTGKKI